MDLLKLQFTDLFGQLKMVEMTGGQAEKAIKRAMQSTVMLWEALDAKERHPILKL